jgi:hypothetical protein
MNRAFLSRRLLQVAAAISSVQALVGGGLYLWRGVAGLSLFTPSPLPVEPTDPTWAVVDYMFRALAGIWFVLGLMLAYVIPSIEKRSAWFALICLAIFGMGVGRFLSFVHFSPAPGNSLGAMVAELVLPPILVLWQRSVARASASQVPARMAA